MVQATGENKLDGLDRIDMKAPEIQVVAGRTSGEGEAVRKRKQVGEQPKKDVARIVPDGLMEELPYVVMGMEDYYHRDILLIGRNTRYTRNTRIQLNSLEFTRCCPGKAS